MSNLYFTTLCIEVVSVDNKGWWGAVMAVACVKITLR